MSVARVNVEQKALTDPRFYRLGLELGAGPELAQAAGLFTMIRVWNECIERGRYVLEGWVIQAVVGRTDGADLVTRSDLAVALKDNRFRVRGTKGRVEYLEEKRRLARINGQKGGRPRKPVSVSKKTNVGVPGKTPPAPAPDQKTKGRREPDLLFDAIAEVSGSDPHTAGGHVAKVRKALADASPPYTPEEVREFGRRFGELCGWAKEGGRVRMPTVGEVEKYIGRVRAAPQVDQDEAGRWEMGRKLAADKAAWEAAKAKPETEPDF